MIILRKKAAAAAAACLLMSCLPGVIRAEGMISAPESKSESSVFGAGRQGAGEVIPKPDPGQEEEYFTSQEILPGDEIYTRILGRSYQENPNIPISELRYLKLLHYNFDHEVQRGEMIVNEAIARDVLEIFRELYQEEYELESVLLVDEFWTGDGQSTDTASMEANNTSCFNYREVAGSDHLSNHALGRAIDVNPMNNPYVVYKENGTYVSPENGIPFTDRTLPDPHVIKEGDTCFRIFEEHGFYWGGFWNSPDYQHFQKTE